MTSHHNLGRLAHVELAAIDLSITTMQALGNTGDAGRDDNPREQMAEALAEMHIRFVANLSERDREIVVQIKALAGQLTARTSLQQLEKARGEVIQATAVSGG